MKKKYRPMCCCLVILFLVMLAVGYFICRSWAVGEGINKPLAITFTLIFFVTIFLACFLSERIKYGD